MLGRVADQLYWMTRYTERMENIARLLDVSYRMSQTVSDPKARESVWFSALEVAGASAAFAETGHDIDEKQVMRFLALDRDFSSSIFSSLRAARENARALRGSISNELWESLNSAWLTIRDYDEAKFSSVGRRDLFDWAKERGHLLRGIAGGTMIQDDAMDFMLLGWHLERADNTARLLDSKYHIILPGGEQVGGSVDYYQWGALLRSVSAYRAYHKIYSDTILPWRVAELLMFRPDMPRSMLACFSVVTETLDDLCLGHPRECQRLAGEVHAKLRFARVDEVFSKGLHEFLTDLVDRSARLGEQIETDFMMRGVE